MNILETEKLTKTYGKGDNKVTAVDNVTLKVKFGEFVAIIGASGSGKSTLLHLLGGVDRPSSGRVLINGEDIFNYSDDEIAIYRRREIGIIYQFYNLIPSLNVADNIALPLKLDHRKVNEEHLAQILRILKLTRIRNHLPSQLSGGQQQRVAIGRALISDPTIILADEPTGNLDSSNSKEVISLLKQANKDFHKTIVIITHDANIAAQADRVITFEDGKIVKDKRNKK
ncbi:MAG: ABC transporter ATP-binding protein [Candidatus Saccharibacteria bacterium]|nr:ABC transporter ATP-binding protein [Candidatus Saccharibacteria bacterium]